MKKKNKTKKVKASKALRVSGNLQPIPPPHAVEITRSFSYKKNLGNYESADFFCCQKSYAKPEEAEKVSGELHAFCKKEVAIAVKEFMQPKQPKNTGEVDKQNAKEQGKEAAELSVADELLDN